MNAQAQTVRVEMLSEPQARVLAIIRNHIALRGSSPTRAEIAREMGWKSANAAEEMVRRLQARGILTVEKGKSRGIRLVEQVELAEYLITPVGVLGADSFTVTARNDMEAGELAYLRIKREEWTSPQGWEAYRKLKGIIGN